MLNNRYRIAIIGGGVAGIYAAHRLSKQHTITIYEARDYLGGHTNTRTIENGPDEGQRVDTGFIVCNKPCYPLFYNFLNDLKVPLRNSDMSFSYYQESTGFGYAGPMLKDALRAPQNFINPGFLHILWSRYNFNRIALHDLEANAIGDYSLGEYLQKLGASEDFKKRYLVPLAASIWSSPALNIDDFPAENFLRFFKNHGMLQLSTFPQWQTVRQGSKAYVEKFIESFPGTIMLNNPVKEIDRKEGEIMVHSQLSSESFDRIVFACHADQVLSLLKEPSTAESDLFGAWTYTKNETFLHTDTSFLPKSKALWSSWNYIDQKTEANSPKLAISYYMNRLQGLSTHEDYVVTLNPWKEIDNRKIHFSTSYSHPVYSRESTATQSLIRSLNGKNNTYYCGSYLGYGFHEDAVRSANDVAQHFGLESV